MSSSKRHLKSLILLVMNVFLCVALLVGSTFAIFTSDDDIGIDAVSASMDMDLLQADDSGIYSEVTNGNVFGDHTWEPGFTKLLFFKVENNSNIHVKYVLRLYAEMGEMAGALEFCPLSGSFDELNSSSWEELTAGKSVYDLTEGYNNVSGAGYNPMLIGGSKYYTVAVHMKESAGNVYMNKTCDVTVNLYAVQGNANP